MYVLSRTHLKNSLSAHGGVMKRLGQWQGALPLTLNTYDLYAPLFRRCMPCPEPCLIFEIRSSIFYIFLRGVIL